MLAVSTEQRTSAPTTIAQRAQASPGSPLGCPEPILLAHGFKAELLLPLRRSRDHSAGPRARRRGAYRGVDDDHRRRAADDRRHMTILGGVRLCDAGACGPFSHSLRPLGRAGCSGTSFWDAARPLNGGLCFRNARNPGGLCFYNAAPLLGGLCFCDAARLLNGGLCFRNARNPGGLCFYNAAPLLGGLCFCDAARLLNAPLLSQRA